MVASIKQSFASVKAILDARMSELVKKACTLAQERKDTLGDQKRVLQMAQDEVKLLVELVKRSVEKTSDQELMSIHTALQSDMEEEEKRHRQMLLKPLASGDIACNLTSPDIFPSVLSFVFEAGAVIEKVESSELGSPLQITVCAPTASLEDISASLKRVLDPSLPALEGMVVSNGGGIFNISLTPQARGQHHLIVKVKGKAIVGNPFQVLVKLPPSELGQQVPRVIDGFCFPWGVAVNNRQQLVVADNEVITLMGRDGEKIHKIKCDHFKNPYGVAIASNGAVYVIDIEANLLFKFSPSGKLQRFITN